VFDRARFGYALRRSWERNWGQIPIRGSAYELAENLSPIWALTPIGRGVPTVLVCAARNF